LRRGGGTADAGDSNSPAHQGVRVQVPPPSQPASTSPHVGCGFEPPSDPYVFIQWKGTDACLDFHCRCGAFLHFDGDFAYNLRCTCGIVWEMPYFLIPRERNDASTTADVIQDLIPDEWDSAGHS
jgi:hypothetical protein